MALKDDLKKEYTALQIKTGKTELEVRREQELKLFIETLDDKSDPSDLDMGRGEKKFTESYVRELREEAKKHRLEYRDSESEKAILKAKLDNIDLDDYQALKKEREEVLRQKEQADIEMKKAAGKFDELIADKEKEHLNVVNSIESKYQEEMSSLQEELKNVKAKNEELLFADTYNSAVSASELEIRDHEGVRLRIEREQSVHVDENGKMSIVLRDSDGEVKLNTETGKPLTVQERLMELKDGDITSYMFASAREGGDSNTDTGVKDEINVDNPFLPENRNLTKQGMLRATDPEAYERLKKEAETIVANRK